MSPNHDAKSVKPEFGGNQFAAAQQAAIAELASAVPSDFAALKRRTSRLVLSDWDDDVVVLSAARSKHKNTELRFDFGSIILNCSGPMSIFDGLYPITTFPNLAASGKAFLGECAIAFETSSKINSEITQNFNNLLRFYLWMIKRKGVYRLAALNRADFNDFMNDFKAKSGWYGLFGVENDLRLILTELTDGKLAISDVCSTFDYSGIRHVRLRGKFLDARIGVPGIQNWIPPWFYDALAKFHGRGVEARRRGPDGKISYMGVYSIIKALNRLYKLPDGFDKPTCRPYPQAHRKAIAVAGTSRTELRQTPGRTANISLEDATKIFSEAIAWIYDYAPGVLKILNEYRATLERHLNSGRGDGWVTHLMREDIQLKLRVQQICDDTGLPFRNVCCDVRAASHDPLTNPSAEDLVKYLMTACFDLIAINHARRLNEVVGEGELPYGLYFGCIKPGRDNPSSRFIDIYIEKTVNDWSSFYVNKLVSDAVSVLEELSQVFRPLLTERKAYETDIHTARTDKLFRYRPFTPKGFRKASIGYSYADHSKKFMKRAGVEDLNIDGRAHPFRRLFALLYWYRYDNPKLLALQHHLRHLSPGVTAIYITDPSMRDGADSIASLYRKRIAEHTAEDMEEINDVRSEAFRDGVIKILRGERRGGQWPRVVYKCYQQLLRNGEFRHLELQERQEVVAATLEERGYSRIPYRHGGCNLGNNDRTRRLARCRRPEDRIAHTEDARPSQCQQCFHHDSADSHIELLHEEIASLQLLATGDDISDALRQAVLEEIGVIRKVIESERALESRNREVLSRIVSGFKQELESIDA